MRIALIGLLMLGGCSTVQLDCPPDRIVTATVNGPDYVGAINQLATLAVSLAAKGALMAAKAPAPASQNNGTMSINTLAWGQQSYSCGSTPPIVAVPAPVAEPAPRQQVVPQVYEPPLPPTMLTPATETGRYSRRAI
jgi:hypothetical protein